MRKTLLFCASVLFCGLVIVALAFQGSKLGRAEFTFNNGAEPESIDPHIMTGQPDGRIGLAIFEGLTYLDPETLEIHALTAG